MNATVVLGAQNRSWGAEVWSEKHWDMLHMPNTSVIASLVKDAVLGLVRYGVSRCKDCSALHKVSAVLIVS